MNRTFDPAMSELDYVLEGFRSLFDAWRGKRIVLHGTREYAHAVIESFDDAFHFEAVATNDPIDAQTFAGKPIWTIEQMLDEKPDLVILTERVRHAEEAYRSLQVECRKHGIVLFDMYGLNWLATMDDIESQTAQSLEDWLEITACYDIVTFELPDCVLIPDPYADSEELVPRLQTKRLIDFLQSQGKRVLYIGRGPHAASEQLEALRMSGLLPEGTSAEDAFFMRTGEDGSWRTIRSKYPRERILHIGYGIAKECILPRYYGVDTYRMSFDEALPAEESHAYEPLISQALSPRKLRRAIEAAIQSSDIVSFDIFDTLLMRTTLRPADVFELVEKQAIGLGISAKGYARVRIAAQNDPHMPKIHEIYRVVQEKLALSDELRDQLLELELAAERNVAIARVGMCDIMRQAIARGKRVFLTSDMYLPEPLLRELLHSKGIDGYEKLLVSCDAGRLKRQDLLACLLETGISAKRIVHMGNSLIDDIAPAKKLGMQAVLIPSAFDLALAYGLGECIDRTMDIDARCELGAHIAERFNDPFAEHAVTVMQGRPQSSIDLKRIAQLGGSLNPPDLFAEQGIMHAAEPFESMPIELRQALLSWYPFERGERALLLGADRDAILPQLHAHFACIDTEFVASSQYDAIILLDPLDQNAQLSALIERLYSALSPRGTLLVGHRNRLGVKYLCGGIDDVVQIPFSSLDGSQKSASLYSEGEMRQLLERSGFTYARTYGIMPDQHFAQAVYTNDYLPPSGVRDRVSAYDAYRSPLVADQDDLYEAMAQNGMLVHAANYLLHECRMAPEGATSTCVVHAALSLDRGAEHSFITALQGDGTVVKRPAHAEGYAALERMYENGEELRRRGIGVVEQRLLPDGLHMPLITERPLLAYLESLLPDKPDEFVAAFDLLYADILRSSDQVELNEHEAIARWGVSAARLGPVLHTGFIDMVPYNAFWEDGRLTFFDQEFSRENCPSKYILFRALKYTWIHLPHTERTIPLSRLKRRFGLTALWNAFERIEQGFIRENRNADAYQHVHQWARTDHAALDLRRRSLLGMQEPTDACGQHADAGCSNGNAKSTGKPYRVGLLMGVFDLFHVGHLRLIKRAKERCDYLRVGVLSDELVQQFKHITPTIPQDQRMEIIGAIAEVDEVVPIDDTPSRIVEWHRRPFDCFFSGDDYAGDEYWSQEKTELEKLGATIEFFPYTKEQSSTRIRTQLS